MFTGCRLFASNTAPVLEFAQHDPDTHLVNYIQEDVGSLLVSHVSYLEENGKTANNGILTKSRKDLRDMLSSHACVSKHLKLADDLN